MIGYRQFCEDFTSGKTKAKTFIDQITISSRFGVAPDDSVRRFLQPTMWGMPRLKDGSAAVTVYRGLNLNHLDSHEKDALRGLQVGSSVPQQYQRPNTGQILIHTTKDRQVAEKYAGNGTRMVIRMLVPYLDVVCDTSNLRLVFDESDFTPEDWNYFDNESEVLVDLDSQFRAEIVEVSV